MHCVSGFGLEGWASWVRCLRGPGEGGVLCIGRPRSPLRGACPEAWRAVGEGVCSLQAGGVVAVGAVRS